MNAYSSYAPVRPVKEPSALDRKMAEKQRLSRAYRRWRRQHVRGVLTAEPRLVAFRRYLRTETDASELVTAIAESWLPCASADVRLLALRMVDARCNRINREHGFEALDDPLPPETSVYFQVRELLHAGGRA